MSKMNVLHKLNDFLASIVFMFKNKSQQILILVTNQIQKSASRKLSKLQACKSYS